MTFLLLLGCPGDPDDSGTQDGTTLTTPGVDLTNPTILQSGACESCGGDCLLEQVTYADSPHVSDPIDYTSRPPAGGPHNPCWAEWEVHTEPVADDNWVHNLEHGGIAYLYNCADCADDSAAMGTMATALTTFALVTPYTDMEARFAAVAWGWRMTMSCYDEPALVGFYTLHVDQAPESITSGPSASCP